MNQTAHRPNIWIETPTLAHQQWRDGLALNERGYAKQSQRLYASLFGRFCAWMSLHKRHILNVNSSDIAAFLESLQGRDGQTAADRTKRTYVAEINRVLEHLQAQNLRRDNPIASMMDQLRVHAPLKPRAIHLPGIDVRQRYIKELAQRREYLEPDAVQRAAMNFLMLDCGLTLKELQRLSAKHLQQLNEGLLIAPGHRILAERSLKMSSESLLWLKEWLSTRDRLKIINKGDYAQRQTPGAKQTSHKARDVVFVTLAGRSDQAHALRSTGLAIDRIAETSIYTSAQDVLVGMDHDKTEASTERNKGPQTLRNLCCANMLGQGVPAGQIAQFLGLSRADQVWAMTRHLNNEKKES